MKTKFDLRAQDHLGTTDGKKHFNEKHFAESAPRYDLATRGLSFGQDASWKKRLIKGLPDISNPVCVDIACGTGDVTFLLFERYREGEFIGVDLTQEMIDISTERNEHSSIRFECGDMCHLQLPDHSVDILTGGYALRNAPDLKVALAEFRRVMKPGGTLAFLDFSKPQSSLAQKVQYGMLRFWGSLWGILLHGNPEVHGYISKSLGNYPDTEALRKTFTDCGFTVQETTPLFGGMMALNYLTA